MEKDNETSRRGILMFFNVMVRIIAKNVANVPIPKVSSEVDGEKIEWRDSIKFIEISYKFDQRVSYSLSNSKGECKSGPLELSKTL